MATFSELGLSEAIVNSLTELGFEEPTPIQTESIPALLNGSDVLGKAATGTGKTAAFALPLLERYCLGNEASEPVVLVLTPTRELCLQVSEAFHSFVRKANIQVTPIFGGQDYTRQIRSLKRGTHVVVATPGRALDHIRRGTLNLSTLKAVVLDEADEMLDMGFADELDAIFELLPENVQTALFSATLPPRIARIAENHLKDPVRITIKREETSQGEAPRVPQIGYVVAHNYRTTALGRIIDLESPELAIIFTRTRMEVDELTEALRARGYSVEALHGGLDQNTRNRVMKRARAGQVDIIVATDVAARGIDLENLTHVINFGIPASYETYVHRIGRTGRAGRTGTAITILEPREHRHLRALEGVTKARIELRSVPSTSDIKTHRLETIRLSIKETLENEDLERYRRLIENVCEEFDPFDVAAAALKLAQDSEETDDDDTEIPAYNPYERPRRERGERGMRGDRGERSERGPRRDRKPESGKTRLFFGIGRSSGVRPSDFVGAIANEANISSQAIGSIDINDRFSLVDIDSGLANDVIEALRDLRIKGRDTIVRLDRPGSSRGDRGDRFGGERFGGDRGDRGGRRDRFSDRGMTGRRDFSDRDGERRRPRR